MSEGFAPSDVLREAQNELAQQKQRNARLLEQSERLEIERDLLQKKVYQNANPNPVLIIALVLVTWFVIYVLYVIFIKPTLSGEWVDNKGNVWNIRHKKFSGEIFLDLVEIKNHNKPAIKHVTGVVIDNFVYYAGVVGVWDYKNKILLVGGGDLQRIDMSESTWIVSG